MEKAVLDYILTCTFAALIGELIGVGPGPGDIIAAPPPAMRLRILLLPPVVR